MADDDTEDDKDRDTAPEGKPDTPQDDLGDPNTSPESEDNQDGDTGGSDDETQENDMRNQIKNLTDIVNQQAGVIEELRKSVASIMDADGKEDTGQDDDSDSGNGAPSQENSGTIKTIEQLFGLEK